MSFYCSTGSLLAVASRRDRLIIALLLDTGLRLSELACLRIDDLLPDGYLRVRGKGGNISRPQATYYETAVRCGA